MKEQGRGLAIVGKVSIIQACLLQQRFAGAGQPRLLILEDAFPRKGARREGGNGFTCSLRSNKRLGKRMSLDELSQLGDRRPRGGKQNFELQLAELVKRGVFEQD